MSKAVRPHKGTPVVAPRPPQAVPQVPAQNLRASLTISGLARTQAPTPSKGEAAAGKTKVEEGKTPAKNAPKS